MEKNDLALFEELIRLKTTNEPEHRGEHDRCREVIAREAARRGLESYVVDAAAYPSILVGARPQDKRPKVLLTAHLDVVPAKPEHYLPRREGNKLFGRGTSDMKFIAPLFLRVLEEIPNELRDRVLIAFTFDEEIGGNAGTRFLLDDYGLRPGTCFLPDGGDNFQLEASEKGVLQFLVKTTGKGAHGSRPWLGENAIDRFMAIYADLRRQFPHAIQGVDPIGAWGPTLNLGMISGGAAANQVANACEARLDTRFTDVTTLAEVRALIERIVGNRGVVEPLVSGDMYHLDPNSAAHQWIQSAAKEHLGRELAIYRSEGASDARFYTRYNIPVVITKPFCGGHHSENEWIDLESCFPYYQMMRDFVIRAAV